MKRKKIGVLPFLVCFLLAVVFLAVFIYFYLGSAEETTLRNRETDLIIFSVFLIAFAFWGLFIIYRIQDRRAHIIFVWFFILAECWLFLGFVKRLAHDPTANEYLWYASYGPLLFMPVMWLALVLSQSTKANIKRFVLIADLTSLLLFALIMTNELHHWAFTPNPEGGSDHGWLYWLVYAYIFGMAVASFFAFFRATAKLHSPRLILFPILALLVIIAYSAIYLLFEGSWLRGLHVLNNYYVMFSFFFYCIIELSLDLGLLQNTGFYKHYFEEGPYRLALVETNYEVRYRNRGFTMVEEIKTAPSALLGSLRYQKVEKPGGYLLIEEDLTDLLRLKKELLAKKSELERANALLKQSQTAESEIEKIKTREKLSDEVYGEIQAESEKIAELADQLPDTLLPTERNRYLPLLEELKIRLCFLKQRCLFVINGSESGTLLSEDVTLSVGSLSQDLRSLGYDVAFTYQNEGDCSLSFALLANAFFRSVIEAYGKERGSLLGSVDFAQEHLKLWVTPSAHFAAEKVLKNATFTEEDGDYLYSVEGHRS